MRTLSRAHKCFFVILFFLSAIQIGITQTDPNSRLAAKPPAEHRDGQHDFDFEAGTWKIHLKRLLHPLTGSTTWVEFDGTTVTRQIWNGRAEIEQFETTGSSGHIEGLTLRLYNPQSHQWNIYWANANNGIIGIPTVGEFDNNRRGEFYDQEAFNGRTILLRFVWSDITPNSAHFEQSFSDDGGKTWEVNWITDQTRMSEAAFKAEAEASTPKLDSPSNDPQHDFDFEIGSWKAHLKRLQHPLTGSNTWIDYDGTSVVSKLWNGRANIGELEVHNQTSHIEGLTLRLYNPKSHQWRLYWANSQDGTLSMPPTTGGFTNGKGEFFDQEDIQDKSIFVRFIFSDISSTSFRTEQAFSPDGTKTWEPNWIATITRDRPSTQAPDPPDHVETQHVKTGSCGDSRPRLSRRAKLD